MCDYTEVVSKNMNFSKKGQPQAGKSGVRGEQAGFTVDWFQYQPGVGLPSVSCLGMGRINRLRLWRSFLSQVYGENNNRKNGQELTLPVLK